ncbi:hypothetical protein WJR50_06225 [Catalinimonas sp. 4WD22]|uniref:YfaP family protein n=1 Tax=Catalinimonas locisalis TaxID=3133978 RepID=UPI0031016CC9
MKTLHYLTYPLCMILLLAITSCEDVPVGPVDPTDTEIVINSFTPTSTYVKTALEIEANVGFDTLSNYEIFINDQAAEIIATNQSKVTVKVPIDLSPGSHAVELAYQGERISSESQLDILDHADQTVDGIAMAVTGSSEFPVVAINEDGEVLIPINNDPDDLFPVGAIYINNDVQTYMSFNQYLLPEIVNTAGYTMLFTNYTDVTFDVAVINPEGEISIHRELAFTERENGRNARRASVSFLEDLSQTASTLNLAACSLSDALLAAGVPAEAVGGIAHCNASLLHTANVDLYNAPVNSIEVSAPAFGIYADLFGCNQVMYPPYIESITDCANMLLAQAVAINQAAGQLREEHAESIELARQSLAYGGGDVQITLTWDNTADIDLHVIEPNGERIYYVTPESTTGGMLDVDDVDGFGPENIFWPTQQSPQGLYQVEVDHYSGESPTNYTVLVQTLGQTRQYSGTITADQTISVVEFTLGETLPEGRFEASSINARLLSTKK